MLIPLSDATKSKWDVAAIGTAVLSFFNAIPWANVAAFLTCLWLALRIIGWCWDRYYGNEQPND